jgi:hypothetical protein
MKNFKAYFRFGLLYFTFLLLPCLLLLARFAGAAPASSAAKSGAAMAISGIPVVVRGDLVDMEAGGHYLPTDSISPILAAIKAYPRAARFQLTWQMHMMNDVTNVRFSYDRRQHTLTVYSQWGEGPSDSLGVMFSSVRQSTLAVILRTHPTGFHPGEDEASDKIGTMHHNNADLWGGFQFLYQHRYRCHAMMLKHGAASVVWPETDWPNSLG